MSRYGGVSGRAGGRSLQGFAAVVEVAPAKRGRYPKFANHGGPVIATPAVRTSFWGASWTTDAGKATMTRLNAFCTDILNSDFMNVLVQYGVGAATFAGSSTLTDVAAQLTNAQVTTRLQKAIDDGAIPEPPKINTSDVVIVFLDESIEIDDSSQGIVMCEPAGDTAFGYHEFFTTTAGNTCVYAVIPALDDACIKRTCPGGDSGCSLTTGATQEERRTQVTSHEFAEMTSDPQLSAWYDPQNGENGDICNGESRTITVGSNTWTVQKIYSKSEDESTDGTTYCV